MNMRLTRSWLSRGLGFSAFVMALLYASLLLVQIFFLGILLPVQRFLFAGGLMGVASVLFGMGRGRRIKLTTDVLLVVGLLASLVVGLAFQVMLSRDEIDVFGRSSNSMVATAVLFIFSWLSIGMAAGGIQAGSHARNMLGSILAVGVASTVLSHRGLDWQLDYAAINSSVGDVQIDHTTIEDSVVLLMLYAYANTIGVIRLVVLIAALLTVFSLGGRATFFIFAVSIFFAMWMRGVRAAALIYALAGIGVFYAIVESLKNSSFIPDALSRMLFLEGLSSDGSVIARTEILQPSLQGLMGQVWFGDAGWIVRNFGSMGDYIHNILSVWQFFGLLPFLIVVLLVIRTLRSLYVRALSLIDRVDDFGSAGFAYAALSAIIAKSLWFGMIWFFLGYWVVKRSMRIPMVLPRAAS